MQGLMVVGFIVDEILSIKYRSRSVGQCGCRVGHRGEAIRKV